MTLLCSLCKNKNNFRSFVRYYRESFEDIHKNGSFNDPHKFSVCHLICSCFFMELELEMIFIKESLPLDPSIGQNEHFVTNAIICNAKNLRENVMDDCSICSLPINGYFLIPCLVKGCKKFFHYQCTKGKQDLQRVKLVNSNNTTFKYGFFCSHHAKESKKIGNIQILRNNEYKVLTNLDESQFESALNQYEEMISKGRSLMEKDPNLLELGSNESHSKTSSINLIKEPSEEKNNNITIEIDDNRPIFQYDTFGDFYDQISDDDDEETYQGKNEVIIRKEDQIPSKSELEDQSEELSLHVVVEEDSQQYIDPADLDNIKIDVVDMMEEPANKPESNYENEHIIETTAQSSPQENKNLESKQSAAKSKKPAVHLEGPVLRPKRIQNFLSMVKKERKPKPEPKEKHVKKSESLNISGKKSKQSALAPASSAEVSDLQPKPVYSDETRKAYWKEINETSFRKPVGSEYELLKPENVLDEEESIQGEIRRLDTRSYHHETATNYTPIFDLDDLRNYTKQSHVKNSLNLPDTLKVLFEFNFNDTSDKDRTMPKSQIAFMSYFRMKLKGQAAMKMPDDLEKLKEETNRKYNILSVHNQEEIKQQCQDTLEPIKANSRFSFFEEGIEEDSLSAEGYYKLFGLKHLDFLTPDELYYVKAKEMFRKELESLEEQEKIENGEGMDDLSKELIFHSYVLNEFVIPENNLRRDKVSTKQRLEEHNQNTLHKLREKTKKLDTELKYFMIKKFFKFGFKDKDPHSINQLYVKNPEDEDTGAPVPKATKGLKNDRLSSKSKSEQQPVAEVDCCICFHHYSSDNNPIIYCSGCDASFHQFCYGMPQLPNDDVYCDACLFEKHYNKPATAQNPNPKFNKTSTGTKSMEVEKTRNDEVRCRICGHQEFPLKRFKKNEWYHITCLMLTDMVFYKNGEFQIKQDKNIKENITKMGVTEKTCMLCNKPGLCVRCSHLGCKKEFHALCAYLEGYETELIDSKDSEDDPAKNGFIPNITCPEHSWDPKRDALKQKYYRRYTTNFKNTFSFDNFEAYQKHCSLNSSTKNPPKPSIKSKNGKAPNTEKNNSPPTKNKNSLSKKGSKRGLETVLNENETNEGIEIAVEKRLKVN